MSHRDGRGAVQAVGNTGTSAGAHRVSRVTERATKLLKLRSLLVELAHDQDCEIVITEWLERRRGLGRHVWGAS